MDADTSDVLSVIIAGVAVLISFFALWHSKRSADAAEQSAKAAERSAAADEGALADARRQEQDANRPRVVFELLPVGKLHYRLRNVGTAIAKDVRVVGDLPNAQDLPDGETLAPNAAHDFYVLTHDRSSVPTELPVMWEGQSEPVLVPFPD